MAPTRLKIALIAAALICAGCRSEAKPPARLVKAVWRPVGTWSGRGSTQTESFELSGLWHIRWETRNASSPGDGLLHVTVNSAVSGRPLMTAVDHRGIGRDTVNVTEDPHLFYLVIDSNGVDWSITAEEPVADPGIAK